MNKYADGGKHSDMAKDKPMMKKVAKAEVMAHEAKMHGKKMADGGAVKPKMPHNPAKANLKAPTNHWAAHGDRVFKKMADGGMACGYRSPQDYGKKK